MEQVTRMKKFYGILLALVVWGVAGYAEKEKSPDMPWYLNNAVSGASWTPLQLGVIPGVQLFDMRTDTCGLAYFLFCNFGYRATNYGFLFAPVNYHSANWGIAVSLLGACSENNGLQVSMSGGEGQNNGLAIRFFNYSDYRNNGIQLGVFNQSKCWEPQSGGQLGAFNWADSGWQFGLLNYNRNAVIQYLPLVNFSHAWPPVHRIPETVDNPLHFVLLRQDKDRIALGFYRDAAAGCRACGYRQKLELVFDDWREYHCPAGKTTARSIFLVGGEKLKVKYAATGLHLKLRAGTDRDRRFVEGIVIEGARLHRVVLAIKDGKLTDYSVTTRFDAAHPEPESGSSVKFNVDLIPDEMP